MEKQKRVAYLGSGKMETFKMMPELIEDGLIYLDANPKMIQMRDQDIVIVADFGTGKDRSSDHIFDKPKKK